jgi:hypothetical protein
VNENTNAADSIFFCPLRNFSAAHAVHSRVAVAARRFLFCFLVAHPRRSLTQSRLTVCLRSLRAQARLGDRLGQPILGYDFCLEMVGELKRSLSNAGALLLISGIGHNWLKGEKVVEVFFFLALANFLS